MTDAEMIEKMRDALEYELINGHVYKPNVAAVRVAIKMVREHDGKHGWITIADCEKSINKVKAKCIEAVEVALAHAPDEQNEAIKALVDV